MSGKRAKQVRRIARNQYKFYLSVWQTRKPSRWRIFRYLKWKKEKPIYSDIEKQIKKICKRGSHDG